MTDNWQVLRHKERGLAEKEDDIGREQRKLKALTEDYRGHFSKATYLFSDIRDSFTHNEASDFFQEVSHDVYQDHVQINRQLEDFSHCLRKESQQLQKELTELTIAKNKLASAEKEETE